MSRPPVRADARGVRRAAAALRRGKLVAFPTETVYGLGADARSARAVRRIFALKSRPFFDPLIVHAPDAASAFALCRAVPPAARKLGDVFWPGPLTLVLPKKRIVPGVVTAGLPTVAVRVPAHPVALRLLRAFGGPIAAPSANRFGRTSPTTARMVAEEFGRGIDVILDGGACRVGVESTVLEWKNGAFRLLRPGGVTLEALKRRVRVGRAPAAVRRGRSAGAPASPGLLKGHYAPRTPLVLLDRSRAAFARALAAVRPDRRARVGLLAFGGRRVPLGPFAACEVLSPKRRLAEAAARLFHVMRKLDRMGLDLIVAERVPRRGLGLAIMDRLERAAAGSKVPRRLKKREAE